MSLRSIEEEIQEKTNRQIQLQRLYNFVQSSEFSILHDHIELTKGAIVESLLKSKDMDSVRELQAKYMAFDSLLTSFEYFSSEYVTNNEDLQELVEEKNLQSKYGD